MMHPNDLPQPRPVYEYEAWPRVTHRMHERSLDDGLGDSDAENDEGLSLRQKIESVPLWAWAIAANGALWLVIGVFVWGVL